MPPKKMQPLPSSPKTTRKAPSVKPGNKMTYIDALKLYNAGQKQWCNPRKGTQQHALVMKIMKEGAVVKSEVHSIEKKEKKEKKSMKIDLK